jgi:small nuclear ribonucleoprotein (snRNP)-like protein
MIVLKDERVLIGILRSKKNKFKKGYDQFTNLVLESTIERITVNEFYCDFPQNGKYIVRSENVMIMGEYEKEVKSLKKVSKEKIIQLKEKKETMKQKQNILKKKLINEKGIIITPEEEDY